MTRHPTESPLSAVAPAGCIGTGRPARNGSGLPRHPWVLSIILALASVGAGCSTGRGSAELMDDSAYVDVMSQLAALRWQFSSRDSLAADSARAAILRERSVDLEALQRFGEAHAADTERMKFLWELIAARTTELASGLTEDSAEGAEGVEPDSARVERR